MEWAIVEYNLGNYFDGTYFTIPQNGLYSFFVTCRKGSGDNAHVQLYLNDVQQTEAYKANGDCKDGTVQMFTTWMLMKNDKVHVRFWGSLRDTNVAKFIFFEGRMVAGLEE